MTHVCFAVGVARGQAIEHPENYVVKPQREGGGNNFYGEDVRRVLKVSPKFDKTFLCLSRILSAAGTVCLSVHWCIYYFLLPLLQLLPRACVKEMSETELSAYILMQRIFPAAVCAFACLRWTRCGVLCETPACCCCVCVCLVLSVVASSCLVLLLHAPYAVVLFPSLQADTTLVRNGAPARGQALCELGIYAPYIGDGERTFLNTTVGTYVCCHTDTWSYHARARISSSCSMLVRDLYGLWSCAGHLVRTKFVGVDEGGVASGYACLSSPGLKA